MGLSLFRYPSLLDHTLQRASDWTSSGTLQLLPVKGPQYNWKGFWGHENKMEIYTFQSLEKPTLWNQHLHPRSLLPVYNVCLDNRDMLEPDDISRDNFDVQPPCEALAYSETSGNATRDRLAALVSGIVWTHEDDPDVYFCLCMIFAIKCLYWILCLFQVFTVWYCYWCPETHLRNNVLFFSSQIYKTL